MTPLTVRLKQYIAIRRSLGFDLSFAERVLRKFAEFADREGADHITVDLFLRWKEHYGSANNLTWCARLSMVRVFAGWLQGFDARTEVPPPGLISSKPRRTRPYIYTDDQIAEIVTEAARLPSSLRAARMDLFDSVRADRRHRAARERSTRARRGGCRSQRKRVLTIRRGEESARAASFRYRHAQLNGSGPIGQNGIGSSARAEPRSSCSRMANARPTAAPATTSRWSASESAFASRSPSTNMAAVRASTICAIPSRCARSWTGIGAASIRIARCSSSAPIWGTRSLSSPTGTSRRSRNCCSSLANARNGTSAGGKRDEEPIRSRSMCSGSSRERLATQLHASPNTVASYRDTFRLLLKYAAERLGRQPTELQIADIDADLIGGFLTFVETRRGNGARSRNTRLSAIRSFFNYVAGNEPQLLHHCQQVLAMPSKRYEKRTIDYLTRAEIEALIGAADLTTRSGRRDRMLLLLALQTGLRVSELINLTCGDVVLGTGAHVRCMGKGRKERSTPLRKDCVEALRVWLS